MLKIYAKNRAEKKIETVHQQMELVKKKLPGSIRITNANNELIETVKPELKVCPRCRSLDRYKRRKQMSRRGYKKFKKERRELWGTGASHHFYNVPEKCFHYETTICCNSHAESEKYYTHSLDYAVLRELKRRKPRQRPTADY